LNRHSLFDEELERVANSLGVQVGRKLVSPVQDYEYEIRLTEFQKPKGLSLLVGDDYFSWSVKLHFDEFATPLLNEMKRYYPERKDQLVSYLSLARDRSRRLDFRINNLSLEELNADDDWHNIELEISQSYTSESTVSDSLFTILLDSFCIVLSLILSEDSWNDSEAQESFNGHHEGSIYIQKIQKYERSRYNRALCLKYYGFKCRGCGFEMESKYGPFGSGVIHVHHIIPVSKMGGSYQLNPVKDLRPLCPNCHNVIHRTDPPLDLENLREITGYTED
jgi:5-methylcytosine-specific restriction protein A